MKFLEILIPTFLLLQAFAASNGQPYNYKVEVAQEDTDKFYDCCNEDKFYDCCDEDNVYDFCCNEVPKPTKSWKMLTVEEADAQICKVTKKFQDKLRTYANKLTDLAKSEKNEKNGINKTVDMVMEMEVEQLTQEIQEYAKWLSEKITDPGQKFRVEHTLKLNEELKKLTALYNKYPLSKRTKEQNQEVITQRAKVWANLAINLGWEGLEKKCKAYGLAGNIVMALGIEFMQGGWEGTWNNITGFFTQLKEGIKSLFGFGSEQAVTDGTENKVNDTTNETNVVKNETSAADGGQSEEDMIKSEGNMLRDQEKQVQDSDRKN